MLSTLDLSLLPPIDRLRGLTQSLAMLDAMLSPEWEYRYYSFNSHWNAHEAMASMRNGSGDHYFLLFTPAGAILKGFAHDSPMTPHIHTPPRVWPGVLDTVPSVFAPFLREPAFSLADTTFCVWRTFRDEVWHRGSVQYPDTSDPDGSAALLALLDGDPRSYQAYAEAYYERPVSMQAIMHVYEHQPLTQTLVSALHEHLTLEELQEDVKEIGYPS